MSDSLPVLPCRRCAEIQPHKLIANPDPHLACAKCGEPYSPKPQTTVWIGVIAEALVDVNLGILVTAMVLGVPRELMLDALRKYAKAIERPGDLIAETTVGFVRNLAAKLEHYGVTDPEFRRSTFSVLPGGATDEPRPQQSQPPGPHQFHDRARLHRQRMSEWTWRLPQPEVEQTGRVQRDGEPQDRHHAALPAVAVDWPAERTARFTFGFARRRTVFSGERRLRSCQRRTSMARISCPQPPSARQAMLASANT